MLRDCAWLYWFFVMLPKPSEKVQMEFVECFAGFQNSRVLFLWLGRLLKKLFGFLEFGEV